jgi:hypothetical protein
MSQCLYADGNCQPHFTGERQFAATFRLACSLALVATLLGSVGRAAIFDFSPAVGIVSADPTAGGVVLSISGQNPLFVSTGIPQDTVIHNGVVAWSSGSTVYSYVFDPARGQWMGTSAAQGPTFDLTSKDGVVAWSTSTAVYFRVYDPARGAWIGSSGDGPAQILNDSGVVAWSTSSRVNFYVYDPTRNPGWRQGGMNVSGGTFDLRTDGGVVAWSKNPRVDYQVYDPRLGQWAADAVADAGFTADLTIQDSQVTWSTTSGGRSYRGYNGPAGTWGNGLPVALAWFAVSVNSGNAPLYVSFIDMSIGGTSWLWNFGDGSGPVARRALTYRYTTFGRFTATQMVNGSTASQTILTDISPPSGTVTINGGANFTTNRNVTLTLSATDNSGLVTGMRFSNDGTSWSDWEIFGTTKAWTLSTNNGNKTVSAQFRDTASNVSATVSASIELDTSTLPIISLVNTNFNEDAGTVTLVAVLDHTYSRMVAVHYTTTNGTASAGSDYETRSGMLAFAPSIRTATFTLTIKEDALVELNETVLIHFSVISNAVAGPPGIVTILDNDMPTVSFTQTNYNVSESNSALITVQLNGASGRAVTFEYAATNGTATADVDYAPVRGVLTIPPGETNQSFVVPLINDTLDELSETVELSLRNATNAVLGSPSRATLTIIDDDNPLAFFSSETYTVSENLGVAEIHVWLSKPFPRPVRVHYATTTGGTATPGFGNDYLAVSGDVEFSTDPLSEDSTNQFFYVNLVNDAVAEPTETIHLRLSNFRDASPGSRTEADIILVDDDGPPELTQPSLGTNGQFQITFQGKPGQRFDVEYSTNLIHWSRLVTLTNTTGTLEFATPVLPDPPNRFYRTTLFP